MNQRSLSYSMTHDAKPTNLLEHTVYTTEELNELMDAVKLQGGQVVHTYSLLDSPGIHVQYMF